MPPSLSTATSSTFRFFRFLCTINSHWKAGDHMTGKEIVNLIRKLKEKGLNSDEILAIIEYIETHDPAEQE